MTTRNKTNLQRHLDSPGLSTQLTVHLQSDLGGDAHQTLGLAEHRGGDALAWDGVLHAALGLDGLVVLACTNIKLYMTEIFGLMMGQHRR